MDISVENSEKHKGNLPYDLALTTHWHMNKGLGTLLNRYFLSCVHCFSIKNAYKMETT